MHLQCHRLNPILSPKHRASFTQLKQFIQLNIAARKCKALVVVLKLRGFSLYNHRQTTFPRSQPLSPNSSNYQFLNYHAHLFFELLRLFFLTLLFFIFYIQPIMHIIHTICNTHYVTQSSHNDSQKCTMYTLIPSYDTDIRHRVLGIHNLSSIL